MSVICPNKNSAEWIALVNKVGEDLAWKIFMLKDDLPSLKEIQDIDFSPSTDEEMLRFFDYINIEESGELTRPEFNEAVDSFTAITLTRYNLFKQQNPDKNISFEEVLEGLYDSINNSKSPVMQKVAQDWEQISKSISIKLRNVGIIKYSREFDENVIQEDELGYEKTSWDENGVMGTDNKFNSSTKLRSFLYITRDGEIVDDAFVPKESRFVYKYVPIDVVFNTLKQITSDSEPSYDEIRNKLKKAEKNFPWIREVLNKLERVGSYKNLITEEESNQLKQEFVTIMTNSKYNYQTFINKSLTKEGVATSRVINTNTNSTISKLKKRWINNIQDTELVKLNNEGEYVIDESYRKKLKKQYDNLVKELKNRKVTKEDIEWITSEFGIKLSDQFIDDLVSNKKIFGKKRIKAHFTRNGGMFMEMAKRLTSKEADTNEAKYHPLYQNSGVNLLSKLQSKYQDVYQAESFRNTKNNKINLVNQQRDFKIRFNQLTDRKNDRGKKKANELLKIPFLKRNEDTETWLSLLAKGDVKFLENFEINFVDAHRDQSTDFTGKEPKEFTPRRINIAKLIGFKSGDGNNYAWFNWHVPGKGAITVKSKRLKEVVDKNGKLTDKGIKYLYAVAQSEMNRIKDGENKNVNGYKHDQFYIFPQLNNLKVDEDSVIDLIKDGQFEQVEQVIKNKLVEIFEKQNKEKKAEYKNQGIINKNDKFTVINQPKEVERYIAEYNLNYIWFHHNMFQTIVGDPALFYKKDIQTTWDNVSKRITKDMTSGVRVPLYSDPEKNYHLQLALEDIKEASQNIDYIREVFGEDSDEYKTFNEIEITDAQEYITYTERLNNFERLGLITSAQRDEVINMIEKGELDNDRINQIKPGLFGPAKPVQTGRRIDGNVEVVDYVKSAEVVLLPQFTKGYPLLDSIREKMEGLEKNGELNPNRLTVRASFKSANKLGGGKLMKIDGEVTKENFVKTHKSGLRYQTEIPYDPFKSNITDGTQPRKIIESLTTPELRQKHRDLYNKIYEGNFNEFNAEFLTEDGKLNEELISNRLQEEALNRGWSDREAKSIEYKNGRFRSPLFLSQSTKAESLINSFINNSIVKNKRNGKSYTAMSEAGLSKGFSGDIIYTDKYDPETGLKPLRVEGDKLLPAQIMIPSYFKTSLEKFSTVTEDGRIVIDSEKIDPELMKVFGYRIPTSGYNLISNFEVVGFLPDYMADTIVATKDVVAQMGMDYDADKLYIYQYNTTVTEDGKIIKEIQDKKKKLQNELLDIEISIMEDAKLYSNIIEPINADKIKKWTIHRKSDNYYDDSYFNERYSESVDAGRLIGTFATTVTFISQINSTDLMLIDSEGEEITLDFADLEGNQINEIQTIKDNRLKSQVISQFLSMALDNDKEPMAGMLNINDQTSSAINAMILSGYDEEIILKVINHPAVKEYIDELNKLAEGVTESENLDNRMLAKMITLNLTEKNINRDFGKPKLSDIDIINDKEGLVESNYNPSARNANARGRILQFFLEAQTYGRQISKLKSTINTDSAFLSTSMFNNFEKEDVINQMSLQFPNIGNVEQILGVFIGQSLQPTTIPGFATKYGLIHNNTLWEKHFPYKAKIIENLIRTIKSYKNNKLTDKQKANILKGIKQYFYSYGTKDLFIGNNYKRQKELAENLHDRIKEEEKKRPENLFLKLIESNKEKKNGNVTLIRYNGGATNGLDESFIHESFLDLIYENPVLGKDILDYVLMSNPTESLTNIRKFIPLEYLEYKGVIDNIYEVTEDVLKNNDRTELATALLSQVIRHNPSLAMNKNEAEKLDENKPTYSSQYNADNNAWEVFILDDDGVYQPIPRLGAYDFSEYRFDDNTIYPSIIKSNNEGIIEQQEEIKKEQLKEEEKKESEPKSSTTLFSKYEIDSDPHNILDNIAKAYPHTKELVDILKAYPQKPKIKVDELDARGVYLTGTSNIIINKDINDTEETFIGVILEEYIHFVTNDVLSYDISSLSDENKDFAIKVDALRARVIDELKQDSEYSKAFTKFLEKHDVVKQSGGTVKYKRKKGQELTQEEIDLFYPIINNQEFAAGIFNKKPFRAYLNKRKFNGKKTLTERFLDLIKNLLESFRTLYNVEKGQGLDEALQAVLPILTREQQKSKASNQFYEGNITPSTNTIFVFGSNPEGRHGAGAAKIARDKFGAKYGQGEGLQGNAYALPTKDLRVKENRGFKSISPKQITENIKKLYEVAKQNPNKQFKVAYRNTNQTSLNGYTGLEMIEMFNQAGNIPSNIIFSKEWFDTGKLNLNKETSRKKETSLDSKESLESIKNDDVLGFTFTDEEDISDFISDEEIRESFDSGEGDDISNLNDLDYAPNARKESPILDYIELLENNLKYYKLRRESVKEADKTKFEKLVEELESEIEKMKEAKTIQIAVDHANKEIDRVEEELKGEDISADNLQEIIRTLNNYTDFQGLLLSREFVTGEDTKDSPFVEATRKVTDRAQDILADKALKAMTNFVVEYSKTQLKLKDVTYDDIFKLDPKTNKIILRDTGKVQAWLRSNSTSNELIDNIVQMSIDLANRVADDKIFKEYKEIDNQFSDFEKSSFYKSKGYTPFYDDKTNLVRRHTQSYYDNKREMGKKYKSGNYSNRVKAFKKYIEWLKNNSTFIDIRKLYRENEDGTIDKLENDSYISQLKEKVELNNIDYVLKMQDSKIDKYSKRLQAQIEKIQNDSNIPLAQQEAEIQLWKKMNSPFEALNNYEQNQYTFTEAGKTRMFFGNYSLYEIPNSNYINENFKQIDENADAYKLYDFLITTLNKYYSKAPDRWGEGLDFNYLPSVPMSMIEELTEKGLFSAKSMMNREFIKFFTESGSPVLFEETDPVTKDKAYTLKFPFSDNRESKEFKEYKQETATKDLRKIFKFVAGKTIDYETKREIESPLKIIQALYGEFGEVKDATDKKGGINIKNDGLGARKAAITYAITKQLYGADQQTKEGARLEKVYNSREKELKKVMESRIKEVESSLEEKNKALESEEDEVVFNQILKDIKALENMKQTYQNDLNKLGRYVSLDSGATALMKYTQLLGMGYNISGAFANLFSAGIGNAIEAAGGENFTTAEFGKAFTIMLNSSKNLIPGAITGGILGSLVLPGFGTVLGIGLGTLINTGSNKGVGKKINSLMTRFKILGNIIDTKSYEKDFVTGERKWYNKLAPYQLYTMSEYFSQGITMVAMMLNKKVEVTEKGTNNKKTISLWDAFNEDGEWNTDLYEKNEGWENQGKDFITTTRSIEQVRDKVHGNYHTPVPLQQNTIGKASMQFRRWMIETVANRVEGYRKDRYLDPKGREVEGRWRIYFERVENPDGKFSYKIKKDRIMEVIKQVAFMSQSKTHKDLLPYQQANLRRNVRELQIFISLMVLYFGMKYMSDDEDENYIANFMLNSLFRISDDLEFYLNPMSVENISGQLLPALKTVNKGLDVLNYGFRIMADDTFLDPLVRNTSNDRYEVLSGKILRFTPPGSTALTLRRSIEESQN